MATCLSQTNMLEIYTYCMLFHLNTICFCISKMLLLIFILPEIDIFSQIPIEQDEYEEVFSFEIISGGINCRILIYLLRSDHFTRRYLTISLS